jgi:hypothetical protein
MLLAVSSVIRSPRNGTHVAPPSEINTRSRWLSSARRRHLHGCPAGERRLGRLSTRLRSVRDADLRPRPCAPDRCRCERSPCWPLRQWLRTGPVVAVVVEARRRWWAGDGAVAHRACASSATASSTESMETRRRPTWKVHHLVLHQSLLTSIAALSARGAERVLHMPSDGNTTPRPRGRGRRDAPGRACLAPASGLLNSSWAALSLRRNDLPSTTPSPFAVVVLDGVRHQVGVPLGTFSPRSGSPMCESRGVGPDHSALDRFDQFGNIIFK